MDYMKSSIVNPVDALREIKSLCDPMEAKFDKIKAVCDSVLSQQSACNGSENVCTVKDLIAALCKMPASAKLCGSEYVEKHDEYACETKPFWVQRYCDGTKDGIVYVGVDYKHPN